VPSNPRGWRRILYNAMMEVLRHGLCAAYHATIMGNDESDTGPRHAMAVGTEIGVQNDEGHDPHLECATGHL